MMMEKILVTGAGGYIGTTLVPYLLSLGYSVRAIDRYFFGHDLLQEHPRLEKVQQDSRRLTLEHLAGIDYVVDLVAISNDPSGELFRKATWQINYHSRVRTAKLAKIAGAKRYILPSSCSIYGFQPRDVIADEMTSTNPLTTYAKANQAAETEVLTLADENFCVIVLRQATVYGYSPRMRFDLAINAMALNAWQTNCLPLMRDGSQWRPFVHVADTAESQLFMLNAPWDIVNGQIFNVGSEANNYQLRTLAELISNTLPAKPTIDWYGDPDHRSYRVSFKRIESLGWRARRTAIDGVSEIIERLASGTLKKTTQTITLAWYQELIAWQQRIRELEVEGGLLDLPNLSDTIMDKK